MKKRLVLLFCLPVLLLGLGMMPNVAVVLAEKDAPRARAALAQNARGMVAPSAGTIPSGCAGRWNTFMGSQDGSDEARAVTIDANCNVYVVGYSDKSWGSPVDSYAGDRDAFVAKFDSTGALVWNTFMGSANRDHGAAIAVDETGNVYVTGVSMYESWGNPINPHWGSYQAFVAKLDAQGNRAWNTFLGEQGSDSGDGYGIAVDASGNVFVVGESNSAWGSPLEGYHGGKEIFVAKLNTNGARQWHTFLGSAAKDTGNEMVLDSSGNIYVVGYSEDTWGTPRATYTGGGDTVVAKLDSGGSLVWNTFMGSGGTDWGWGIAIDTNQNVYASGYSDAEWGSPETNHAGGVDGFAAKLDSDGYRQWNTFFGSATDDQGYEMSLDGNGNLYVAGAGGATWGAPLTKFAGTRDGFVVKLNNAGGRVWNTFMGSAADDMGNDLVVDARGDVFVAGISNASWGVPVNAYTGDYDGFVAKLTLPLEVPAKCSGSWQTFVGSVAESDDARAVAIDMDCNLYVTGTSHAEWGNPVDGFAGTRDAYAAKFDASGQLLWNTFMGSSDIDHGAGIAVDVEGNVYVTGISMYATWGNPIEPHAGDYQAFIAKLNSHGARQWNTFLGGPGISGDGYGIETDESGNVFVIGESRSDWGTNPIDTYHGGREIFVAKLDTGGNRLWHTFLGSAAKDAGFESTLDSDGNIYVTGMSEGSWGSPRDGYVGGSDGFAVKLDSDGTVVWNTFMGAAGTDWGWGIAVDSAQNVYLSGHSVESWGNPIVKYNGGADCFALKLNSSGVRQWNTFIGSATDEEDCSVVLDAAGNLYISGGSDNTWGNPANAFAGPRDAFVLKLDNDGKRVWNTFWGSPDDDVATDIVVDQSGNSLIVGYSNGSWNTNARPNAGSINAFVDKLDVIPTAVTLASFSARAATDRVIVKWNTTNESLVSGFNLWRRTQAQADFQRVNVALIPAKNPGIGMGNAYTFTDKTVRPGQTLRYKLQVVMTNGKSEWSDAVKVNVPSACAAAPGMPLPTAPRDGATVNTTRVMLKWQTVTCATSYRVMVRQGSINGTVVDKAMGLTKSQHETIALKPGKTYYWQVRACSAVGCSAWSKAQSFRVPAN